MKRFIIIQLIGFTFSISLFAQNLSNKEVNQWKSIGVSKSWIGNWTSQGLTYQEAKKWVNAGIGTGGGNGWSSIMKWKKYGITPEEVNGWKSIGISTRTLYRIKNWKDAGINSPMEAKKWKDLGVSPNSIYTYKDIGITLDILKTWQKVGISSARTISMYKKYGINNPKEAKKWRSAGVVFEEDLSNLQKANIKTPEEADKWIEAGFDFYDIPEWKKLGINTATEAKAWKNIADISSVTQWKKAGVSNPKEVEKWKKVDVNVYNIENIKKANINIDEIYKWKKVGITNVENIILLVNSGFKKPNQYMLYKDVYLKDAIKLKQWGIKPNKLINSMSYSNIIFGQELYFNDKNTFKKAYASIKDNCSEIVRDKWFAGIDMSENKNKCYIFVGTMMQRLDEKSLFGKVTKSGLVRGMGKRYFYAENFQNNWMKNKTQIGVIKGDGSFSYNSRSGKQLVPKGIVIFSK